MYLDVQAHGALQTIMSDKQRLGKLEASRCALLLCDVQVSTLRSSIACTAIAVVTPQHLTCRCREDSQHP